MAETGVVAIVVKRWPKLSETFVLEEVLGLQRRGLDLCVIALEAPSDDLSHPEVAEFTGTTMQYPGGLRVLGAHARLAGRHPVRYLRALRLARHQDEPGAVQRWARAGWVASLVGPQRISHFHSHFASEPTSVTELASRLSDRPFSISAHAKDIYVTDPAALRRKITAATFVTTCTAANADHLRALAPDGRVVHTPHGVHLDRFPPGQPAGADPATPTLVGVGRLRPKKGFDLLIRATAALHGRGHDVRCRILGYGPEQPALEELACELGVEERVSFEGKVPRRQVFDAFAAASVVVQPCRVDDDGDRDGIPNVLLEAMALGTPVVTTAVSGIPELVTDGVTGRLVAPDDVAALTDAVADLLDRPDEATRLGAAGRQRVETWPTVDESCRRLAELLRPEGAVAYVVKGYPRRSEIFIANEIHRMESLGLAVRLFAIKRSDEPDGFAIADRVVARPHHLPAVSSISGQTARAWLRANLGNHSASLGRVVRQRPGATARAATMALAQAWRARDGRRLRKVYLKDFMHAVALADQVLADPSIRHLHAHFAHGATTVTWLAATMTGRSFSFTAHAKDIYEEKLNPAGLLARKLRAARFVATCTDANRHHLAGLAPNARIETVYHGLNDEMAEHLGAPMPPCACPPERPEVLSVGRHVTKKGFDTLVRAVAELRSAGYDLTLRIVGSDGDATELLHRTIDDHALADAVTLHGAMGQRELLDAYRRATVFALACRVTTTGDRDGIPNVLMECMAAGTAVVSTAISGIPELVVDGETGLLVEPDDPHALAKAIARLLDDPELRASLQHEAAAAVASRFDGWSEARRLADLLRAEVRP